MTLVLIKSTSHIIHHLREADSKYNNNLPESPLDNIFLQNSWKLFTLVFVLHS